MGKKVLVALSGGVDSAVAAFLLQEQGYDVSGVYMRTWMNEETQPISDCPWKHDLEEARKIGDKLKIPFQIANLIEAYRKHIVQYLVSGYQNGITPNPDIYCNREIKFGVLLEHARQEGFDYIATGHYCQKTIDNHGNCDLWEAKDKNKDQSYFLALLKQDQIKQALFPIGGLTKPEVREIAQKAGLPNALRKDSQGICFLGKVPIHNFLEHYIPDNPGEIVNAEGRILGKHAGLHRFTLGQRKGIGIPSNTDFEHYVVIAKDYNTNRLIVAFESKSTPGLYAQEAKISNISWTHTSPLIETLLAKPRYRDPSQTIHLKWIDAQTVHITFQEKQRALAQGQILAFYEGTQLKGGGVFSQIYPL